jgi:hypothetical protein
VSFLNPAVERFSAVISEFVARSRGSCVPSSKDDCVFGMDWSSHSDRMASGQAGKCLYSEVNSAVEPSPDLQVKPTTKFVNARSVIARKVISLPNGKSIGGIFDFPSASIQFA